jgi:hypothetical protein
MDRTVTFKQEKTSGHEPKAGLDTKTDRLTDCQSQRDFDFDCRKMLIACLASSVIQIVNMNQVYPLL